MFAVIAVYWVVSEIALRRSGVHSWRRRPIVFISISADGPSFRGGALIGSTNATPPFAKLSFDRDGAAIGIWPFDRATILRSNVVEIKRIRVLGSTGIRFVGRSGEYDSVVFWTSDAATVLWELRAWGWPVPE